MKVKYLISRAGFVLLSSTVMVFFSEKTFWYIQGYPILELVLFYAVPAAVCLAVISFFQVQRLSGLVLAGALFGFLVEGTLTPILYEGGLLDPFLPAYFVGWHGLLSVVLGWYLIRKWLVEDRWRRLLTTGTLFGLFWGIWSLGYWLPESVLEFEGYVLSGEVWLPGAWSVGEFATYTLVFTGMLMTAHWLLSCGLWQQVFPLRRWEIGVLGGILGILYLTQVLPVIPLGFLKLAGLSGLVLVSLWLQQRRSGQAAGLLTQLAGPVRFSTTLALLSIPLSASLVYILGEAVPVPEDLIRASRLSLSVLQAGAGAGAFLWALVDTLKKSRPPKPGPPPAGNQS